MRNNVKVYLYTTADQPGFKPGFCSIISSPIMWNLLNITEDDLIEVPDEMVKEYNIINNEYNLLHERMNIIQHKLRTNYDI